MKAKTFTVMFVEEFPHEMTDEEVRGAFVQSLQDAYDGDSVALGGNFLLTQMEDGDTKFWDRWVKAIADERKSA